MFEVRPGFLDAFDRVALRGRAERQSVELREDVPHPVRALLSAGDFRERSFVIVLLRPDEPAEVVWVVHDNALSHYPMMTFLTPRD